MLIYLLDFYLKIFDLNVLNCLALQHFEFKEDNWEEFFTGIFLFYMLHERKKKSFQ